MILMKLSKFDIQRLCEVEALILVNLKVHYTVQELATKTGLNKDKIKKGFKLHFGSSTKDVLLRARMAHAKMMIEETDKPIKEIAGSIGYSYSSFIFKFRLYFGFTPHVCRKR
jgi:AraC-like DNA-binding protein